MHCRAERLTLTTRSPAPEIPAPSAELAAGLVEHPGADRHDQAGVLRDRNEFGREHQSAARVMPAQQRLEPGEPRARQRDDRLVVDLQLVPFERPAQILFEPQPFFGRGEHRRVEDFAAGLAQFLRPIHRGIRVADHVLRALVAVGADDEPDADRRDHLPSLQLERLRHGGTQPFGDRQRAVGVADAVEQDRELVAAHAGERVARLRSRATVSAARSELSRRSRDLDQQLVARRVAQAVVDDLEAIEVEEQHGERRVPRIWLLVSRRLSRSMNSTRFGRPVSGSARRAVTCARIRASATAKSIGLVT